MTNRNLLVVIVILTCHASVYAGILGYQYYDLSSSASLTYVQPFDIDDEGNVVLEAEFSDESYGSYTWENGRLVPVPQFPEVYDYFATRTSNTGVLGGTAHFWDQQYTVFAVWSDHYVAMPFGIDCRTNPTIEAISSSAKFGTGVCPPTDQFYNEIATLYDIQAGETRGLPLPEGAPEFSVGWGYGVNDDGIVAGFFRYPDEVNPRGYVYKDGIAVEVFNAIGGVDIGFEGLNNAGLAVGNAEDVFGESFAIGYDVYAETTTILGPGSAKDVNERGQACGIDLLGFGIAHPVAYIDGETIYLDDFMPDDLIFYSGADAINNHGWLTGYACTNSFGCGYVGWLLVPIYSKGDYDGDDDVDLHDFGHFQECFAAEPYQGPEGGLHVGCSVFDFDDDNDLDLTDYQAFQAAFTGAITSGW